MLTIKIEKDGVTLVQIFVPETGGTAQVASSSSRAAASNRLSGSFRQGRVARQSQSPGSNTNGDPTGDPSLEE